MDESAGDLFGVVWIRRTASRIGPAVFDQILSSGMTFLFFLVVGRLLLPVEFGAFSLFYTSLMLAVLVHSAVVLTPLTVDIASLRFLVKDVLGLHIAVSGVAAACWVLFVLLWPESDLSRFAISGALTIVAFLSSELARRVLMARARWRALVLVDGLGLTARLGLLGPLWIAGTVSASWAVVAVGIGAAVTVIAFAVWEVWPRRSRYQSSDVGTQRLSRRMGGLLLGGQLASWGNSQGLAYVVAARSGAALVGHLTAAQMLVAPVSVLLIGLGNWALPEMVRRYDATPADSRSRVMRRQSVIIGGVLALLCVLYGVVVIPLADPLMELLFPGRYPSSEVLVAVIVLALALSAFSRGLSMGLTVRRNAGGVALGYLIALPLVLTVAAILPTAIGPALVPVGSSVGSIVSSCVMLYLLFDLSWPRRTVRA